MTTTPEGNRQPTSAGLSELPFLEGCRRGRRRRVVFVTFRRVVLELCPMTGSCHVLLLLLAMVVQVALLVRLGLRVVHVDGRMLLDLDLVHGLERVGDGGGRRRRGRRGSGSVIEPVADSTVVVVRMLVLWPEDGSGVVRVMLVMLVQGLVHHHDVYAWDVWHIVHFIRGP